MTVGGKAEQARGAQGSGFGGSGEEPQCFIDSQAQNQRSSQEALLQGFLCWSH
jgi:hypothetical protein